MPRQRQEAINEATRQSIKDTARHLMAEKGTAGLSLRAIARNIGMTAPALYHYFASLDDLITALIVDAFTSYADYVRAARDAAADAGKSYDEQLFEAALAYRQWALENTTDFQLIYGNPIPGYVAPPEITTPAASQMGNVFMETLLEAQAQGAFTIAEAYRDVPPAVASVLRARHLGDDAPEHVLQMLYMMNSAWGMMHGLVTLEVYNHLKPVVGDTDTFYCTEIRRYFGQLQEN